MVYIYGVIHGGHWRDIFGGRAGEIIIEPTEELIEDLARFPKGTKVGIESLSDKDWDEVNTHLLTLPFNPPKPIIEGEESASRPFFETSTDFYWDCIRDVCYKFGFDVVNLEDKHIWFKYNQAIIKAVVNEAKRRNLLVKEKGESEEHYDRKRIALNLENYLENINIRRIHEIDRDEQLLRAIKDLHVDVAFVGIGHSDYWIANKSLIQSRAGINFEGYSTEEPAFREPYKGLTFFDNNAEPDVRRAFVRDSLERVIKLIEIKRLNLTIPSYFGTWDINESIRGYFEMTVNRKGKTVNGEIIDCLGDANFEGEIDDKEIRFVKKYNPERCCEAAPLKGITYKGIIRDGNIIGYYFMDGIGLPFIAAPQKINSFVDLGHSWTLFAKRYKKDLLSLGERLDNDKTEAKYEYQENTEYGSDDSPF